MEDILYCPLLEKSVDWEYCHDICNYHSDGVLQADDKISDWDKAQTVCEGCTRYTGAKTPHKSDFASRSIISQACS